MMIDDPHENSPLLESQMSKKSSSSSSSSCCGRLRSVISNITVEPFLFLHGMSFAVASIFNTNMLLDKVCSIQLNYSKEICDNLDSGNHVTEQNTVQRITNEYILYATWIEYGLSAFVMILLGAWSDTRGRKLPLLFPVIGETLKSLALLANAYFWNLQPYFIILSYIPYGLGGSFMAVIMTTSAYVGNHSGDRSRTSRLSITGLMMFASMPIGQILGAIIYKHGGYVYVFGTEGIFSVLSIFYILVRFKSEPPSKHEGEADKSPREKKFTLATVKASMTVMIKPREGKQRAHVIAHSICIWVSMISSGSSFTYLYARKKFGWNYYDYTIWSSVSTPVSLLASCVILPILSYHFQIEDSMLGFIGSVSHMFYGIITGTAPFAWLLYVALVVSSFSGMVYTSSRGAISKLVASDELGGIFSILALGETIIPMITSPLFILIYNNTLESFPGTVFIIGSLIAIVVSCIYTWILTSGEQETHRIPVH